ncbi:hypothetical protein [uncultured Sphaerochaeta sp.]|uniref:hypothetical protein n=1 Tax=uncultured Sphaerochaeta sp. TaxID=886478 RepID=UPI002A0A3D06|nr:hypothetical protein [uncultured Sphaerochaeta sp.]
MKKTILPISLIFLIVMLTSCATILSDSNYPVTITSAPAEARILITDNTNRLIYTGSTPATVFLNAGNGFFTRASYTITFEKAGFEPSIYILTSTLDGWYWGNLLVGGLFGMIIIDPATGSMWKLDQNISMKLNPKIASSGSISIMSYNDIPQDLRNKLVKIS